MYKDFAREGGFFARHYNICEIAIQMSKSSTLDIGQLLASGQTIAFFLLKTDSTAVWKSKVSPALILSLTGQESFNSTFPVIAAGKLPKLSAEDSHVGLLVLINKSLFANQSQPPAAAISVYYV